MSQQHPQLDGQFNGSTNPRRHRTRWLMTALSLLALVVATVVVSVSLVRGIFFTRNTSDTRTPSVTAPTTAVGSAALDEGTIEEKPDVAAEDEAADEPARVRLLMIGDVLMHDGVIYSGEREDGSFNYDHLFAHITDDVQAADVAVLNQETILGGDSFAYSGYPMFNSPQALGDAEVDAGFDVILKATNHTLDMGYDGVRNELAYWAENHPEMAVIGMADPNGDGICPAGTDSVAGSYIYEKDGLRVAMLNYTQWFNLNIDEDLDYQVVAGMFEEDIRADIAAAREQADMVVVFPHWGNEYETWPSEAELWWAEVMADAGADVIIGGHPHVIQPVEVLGEEGGQTLVFWSVGNFVSNMAGADSMVGAMATVDFVKDEEGARVEGYELMPLVTQREPWSTANTTYKLIDYTDELAAESSVTATDPGRGYSREWYVDFCADVLGEDFDYETLSVHGSLQ